MRKMLLFFALLFVASPFTYAQQAAAPSTKEAEATKAAESWLGLIDEGKLEEAWEGSPTVIKEKLTKEQFADSVTKARDLVGKFESRKFKSAQTATKIPGGPAGEQIIVKFDANFSKAKGITETVILMLENSQWKAWRYSTR